MNGQFGFFDLANRYEELSHQGDPLERLNAVVDWKIFLPLINRAFDKARKSPAGRKPFNRLMMFKVLLLQGLYNLSDAQAEYQIKDRLSFMRFLGLSLGDEIPDEKTIWAYREALTESEILKRLFNRFDRYLEEKGLFAELGHIVDASIVEVPKQRNSRGENAEIKAGKIPESFQENLNKLRQKDIDARWTIKNGKTYYGYKDHVNIDVKHKLIRSYEITTASDGDKWQLEKLLDNARGNEPKVWADGAYFSAEQEVRLKKKGYISRILNRTKKFSEHSAIARENRRRTKIRKRVEHIFGFIQNSMHGKFIRTVGIARAKVKIGLMNLVYNLCRYEQLHRMAAP
jgi:IS5 family transposase